VHRCVKGRARSLELCLPILCLGFIIDDPPARIYPLETGTEGGGRKRRGSRDATYVSAASSSRPVILPDAIIITAY
jgi:hypothetical protein